MGWICEPEDGTDLYGHEGSPVAVDAAGVELAPIRVKKSYGEAPVDATSWHVYDGQQGRPLAAAVVAGCSCGWRSDAWHPINWEDHEATDGSEYSDGPWLAWSELHIRPLASRSMPSALSAALEAVDEQLRDFAHTRPLAALAAVAHLEARTAITARSAGTTARRSGTSWDQIGEALGMTRQGAHRRLARHVREAGEVTGWSTKEEKRAAAAALPPVLEAMAAPSPCRITVRLAGDTRTVNAVYHHIGDLRGHLATDAVFKASTIDGGTRRASMLLRPAGLEPRWLTKDDQGRRWDQIRQLATGTHINGWWDETTARPAAAD
ncbi:hypothetical protein ACWC9S_27185 [Streptomyces xiamenensis]